MFGCYDAMVCPCLQVPLWDGSIRAIMALGEIECWSLLTRRIPDTGTRQQSGYQLTGYYNYLCWPGSMDTCQQYGELSDTWDVNDCCCTESILLPDYSMHNPNPGLISCKSSPAQHCLWPPVNDTTLPNPSVCIAESVLEVKVCLIGLWLLMYLACFYWKRLDVMGKAAFSYNWKQFYGIFSRGWPMFSCNTLLSTWWSAWVEITWRCNGGFHGQCNMTITGLFAIF